MRRIVTFILICMVVAGAGLAVYAKSTPGPAPLVSSPSPSPPSTHSQAISRQPVQVIVVKGIINPVVADYVLRGITRAEQAGAILIIEMDTPGGLMDSMREIITRMQNAVTPVVVYVYPPGSRAASAGLYILYGATVAVMAPTTNTGSAHPIFMGVPESKKSPDQGTPAPGSSKSPPPDNRSSEEILLEKVTNDSVAYIRNLAKAHHRNADWAEKAVRESVNIGNDEALKLGVVEIVARNVPDLLRQLDGRKVEVAGKPMVLHPESSVASTTEMTWIEMVLHLLTGNPEFAIGLMGFGVLALMIELYNPGLILPGIVGVICLLLGLFGIGQLPINYAGLGLILFGLALFVTDIYAVQHGFLTAGGIIAFLFGSLMLIPAGYPELAVSKSFIFWMTASFAAVFAGLLTMVVRNRQLRSLTGSEGIVGSIGAARTDLAPSGMVFVDGALWKAEAAAGAIRIGEHVKVIGVKGLTVTVTKVGEK